MMAEKCEAAVSQLCHKAHAYVQRRWLGMRLSCILAIHSHVGRFGREHIHAFILLVWVTATRSVTVTAVHFGELYTYLTLHYIRKRLSAKNKQKYESMLLKFKKQQKENRNNVSKIIVFIQCIRIAIFMDKKPGMEAISWLANAVKRRKLCERLEALRCEDRFNQSAAL